MDVNLLDNIIKIARKHRKKDARRLITDALIEHDRVGKLADQINVSGTPPEPQVIGVDPAKPGADKTVEFTMSHTTKSAHTGEIYDVFDITKIAGGAKAKHKETGHQVFIRPHNDGKELTDKQIAKKLTKWNKEAAKISKGMNPPSLPTEI